MTIIKSVEHTEQTLFTELSQLIEQSQQQVVSQANSTLTMLFWHIGNRINKEILQNKRADYGKLTPWFVSHELFPSKINSRKLHKP